MTKKILSSEEKQHKKVITAWTMYDWGNSAFATTIMAAVLPVYYSTVAAANLPKNVATAYWGFTSSISAAIAAILSPILGAYADFKGSKKRFLTVFMILGVFGTALLYFIKTGDWLLASLFFVFANIGFAGSWCITIPFSRTSLLKKKSTWYPLAVMQWVTSAEDCYWQSI